MTGEITPSEFSLGLSGTQPIDENIRPAALRRTLQERNGDGFSLVGADQLGMNSCRVQLFTEPDLEFLVVFAQAVERGFRERTNAQTIFLDDGILEVSAGFDAEGAWSRMGYLDKTRTVRMSAERLVALWRGFVEQVVAAAEAQR